MEGQTNALTYWQCAKAVERRAYADAWYANEVLARFDGDAVRGQPVQQLSKVVGAVRLGRTRGEEKLLQFVARSIPIALRAQVKCSGKQLRRRRNELSFSYSNPQRADNLK
jgi:hypothetical protein